jgi:hypothetical protein
MAVSQKSTIAALCSKCIVGIVDIGIAIDVVAHDVDADWLSWRWRRRMDLIIEYRCHDC